MFKSNARTISKALLLLSMANFLACGGMYDNEDSDHASSDENLDIKLEVTHEHGYTELPSGNDDLV